MESDTRKEQQKELNIAMVNVFFANAKTQDCNISGGNVGDATRCQTWGGCNAKRSEPKKVQSHSVSGQQVSSLKSGPH
eukprot:9729175-Heterocapsa_arctica.AAC.1